MITFKRESSNLMMIMFLEEDQLHSYCNIVNLVVCFSTYKMAEKWKKNENYTGDLIFYILKIIIISCIFVVVIGLPLNGQKKS